LKLKRKGRKKKQEGRCNQMWWVFPGKVWEMGGKDPFSGLLQCFVLPLTLLRASYNGSNLEYINEFMRGKK
jgi:hypothetical protein